MSDARQWLERIRSLRLPGRLRIMNVCGGHERSITMAGLRGALPPQVELIPGPGSPVCVCPEEDIYAAIQLARQGVVVAEANEKTALNLRDAIFEAVDRVFERYPHVAGQQQ